MQRTLARKVCLIIAVVFIVLAACAVHGPTINSHPIDLFFMGIAFWALSFAVD